LDPEEPKDDSFTVSRKPGIKICPRCGSMDVDATTGTGYVSPPLYVCNRCGFAGAIFPELDKEEAMKHAQSAGAREEGGEAEEAEIAEENDDEED
jgi:predicted RNA-binding Zn-ribbon protein involved in translation (DUF1610 family)